MVVIFDVIVKGGEYSAYLCHHLGAPYSDIMKVKRSKC